jgi:hypothetical protein
MTKKYLTILSICIIAAVSACGPAPAPTLSVADIANTAAADAWLAVTMTQAALPTATATLIPPSETPMPTFTPFPTLPLVTSAPVQAVGTTNPCDPPQPPPVKPKGSLVKVKFVNKSGGSVNLSYYMTSPNSQGECVGYTFVLGRFDSPVETILAGCYWAYGWVTGDKPSTAQAISLMCITDPNLVPAVWINTEVITFH